MRCNELAPACAFVRAKSAGAAKDIFAQAVGYSSARQGNAGRVLRAKKKGGLPLVQVFRAENQTRKESTQTALRSIARTMLGTAPPVRTKRPAKVQGGYKSARTRDEQDEFASREIDPDYLDIWEKVRWNMPLPAGRYKAEAFMEWVNDSPEEIAAMRGKDEAKAAAALERLSKRCVKIADRALKDLTKKNFDSLASFAPLIKDQLAECAVDLGNDYDPEQLEAFYRLEATGAPF